MISLITWIIRLNGKARDLGLGLGQDIQQPVHCLYLVVLVKIHKALLAIYSKYLRDSNGTVVSIRFR